MLVLALTASLSLEPLAEPWRRPALPDITWVQRPGLGALADLFEPPAAIVLEAGLPGTPTEYAVAALRLRFPDAPLVLIADLADPEQLARWLSRGVADVVRRDDLVRLPLAVANVVGRRAMALEVGERRPAPAAGPPLHDELYQVFVSQSHDGIWCFALDPPLPLDMPLDAQIAHAFAHATLVECNDAMARMYGYAQAADLLGARLSQLLDPADPRNSAYLRAFFEHGYRLDDAISFERDRDGNELVFANSLIGTVAGRQLTRAWGIQRDVTGQVREAQAQELRAAAGAVLAEALDYDATLTNVVGLLVPEFADYCLVSTLEADGALVQRAAVHRDPGLQPLLGRLGAAYDRASAPAASAVRGVLEQGHTVFEPNASLARMQAILGEGPVLDIYRRLNPRSYLVVPLRARGQVRGALTLARTAERQRFDRADLALAEELALRCAIALDNAALYAEAQAAIAARDALLAVASHELRTPLTAVMGFAALLQRRCGRKGNLDEREQRMLDAVVEQSARMERLIALVVDEARLAAGRLELAPAPLDLAALVRRSAERIELGLEQHQVHVATPAAPVPVAGDQLRLEQVVEHLLLNAAKYSPEGGPIEVALEADGQTARLEVRDHGIGIPAGDLPRVGERFFRARNVTRRQLGGTGIGLYVLRQLVAAHGGSLELSSVEDEGTTVRIRLPLAQPAARQEGRPA